MSLPLLYLVTELAPPGPDARQNDTLVLILSTVATVDLALSFVVPRFVGSPSGHASTENARLVIAMALCESAALFGVVLYTVTAWSNFWWLLVLGGIGMMLHFPRESGQG